MKAKKSLFLRIMYGVLAILMILLVFSCFIQLFDTIHSLADQTVQQYFTVLLPYIAQILIGVCVFFISLYHSFF